MEEQMEEEGDIGCVKRRTLQSDWSKHAARGNQMHCKGQRGVLRWHAHRIGSNDRKHLREAMSTETALYMCVSICEGSSSPTLRLQSEA